MRTVADHRGRPIRLTVEREQHILEHPEMAGMAAEIEKTLSHPQHVIQSASDASVELSYRFHHGTKVGDKWLCVVVKCLPSDAFVITAYLTDKLKKGTLLWPKK